MAKINGPTGTASAYSIEPATDQVSTPHTVSTTEATEETPDRASALGKRLESAIEADYMRDQLNRAQQHPGVGVLYDKHSHDPAAHAIESKGPAPVSIVGLKLGSSKDSKDLVVKKEVGTPRGMTTSAKPLRQHAWQEANLQLWLR